MKNLVTSLLLFFSATLLISAQNTIEVEITNFDNNLGVAFVGLYNSEKSFLETAYRGEKAEITNQKVIMTFTDIPDGTYAISVFHDEDENGELSTNFLGIPKESYGASNDAPAMFGPPKWKDARFEVRNGGTVYQKIKL